MLLLVSFTEERAMYLALKLERSWTEIAWGYEEPLSPKRKILVHNFDPLLAKQIKKRYVVVSSSLYLCLVSWF